MFNEHTPVTELVPIFRGPPKHFPDGWLHWTNVRDALIFLLEEKIKNCPPYPEGMYSGRGIVSSVNAKPGLSSGKNLAHGYFPGAWCMVKELRRLGCNLPVAFTYMGDQELDPFLIALVKKHLNAECIDLHECNKTDPMRILAGWESKVYGIIQAPFEQVLYLDADCLPIENPEFLFDSPQLKFHGAILWPDMPPYDRTEWLRNECWTNVGLEPRTDYVDAESGQLIIDKRRWHEELIAVRQLNETSDHVYRYVFGDKSTFVLGSAKVQHMLGKNGHAMPSTMCTWDGANIRHYGFNQSLLFQQTYSLFLLKFLLL